MKRTSWYVLLGLLGLFAFMLGPAIMAGPPADEPAATPTPTETETPSAAEEIEAERRAFERAILREINRERRSRGLSGLEMSEPQRELARSHSKDMARDGYYNHTAPDGRTFLPACRPSGEVLFRVDSPTFGDHEYGAQETTEAWLASPEHQEIFLKSQWTSIGIGIQFVTGGPHYITANFC